MENKTPVLEVQDLSVNYGIVPAVDGVSFALHKGTVATIVGSNGAGKSTIMKSLAGLIRPHKGQIRLFGKDVSKLASDQLVAQGLVLVPEGRRLFKSMSVRENLETGAYRQRDKAVIQQNLDKVLIRFPALKNRLAAAAGSLSGGQQQMVAVGRALMAEPRVLLLDEPTIGLAPAIVDDIAQIILDIAAEGVDVLLVEQNAEMALEIASHAFIIERGRVVLEGPASELARSEQVRKSYLGI